MRKGADGSPLVWWYATLLVLASFADECVRRQCPARMADAYSFLCRSDQRTGGRDNAARLVVSLTGATITPFSTLLMARMPCKGITIYHIFMMVGGFISL